MDPDANLEELLELARLAIEQDCLCIVDTLRLAELIVTLDKWIRKGGFLPEAWRKRSLTATITNEQAQAWDSLVNDPGVRLGATPSTPPPKHTVLVSGNPFDGLILWGPFADSEEAGDYAEQNKMDQWTAVGIEPVDEDSMDPEIPHTTIDDEPVEKGERNA